MNTITALYAGSFDPFTIGHLSIVEDAAQMFDKVYVCIAVNIKKYRKTIIGEMAAAITETLADRGITNAEVVFCDGLIADYCKANNIRYLIRGLRNTSDYLYEENIAKINFEINPDLRTIYFRAHNDVVSSSMVRELKSFGHDVSKYLPPAVAKIYNHTT